jgi:hypothetical protein
MSSWLRVCVASCAIVSVGVLYGQSAIRTVDKGAQSNVDDRLTASAHTEAEWTTLWKKHNFEKPAPRVDFSKEMVVAVFMGSRPTAGFSVELLPLPSETGSSVVTYREAQPCPRRNQRAGVDRALSHRGGLEVVPADYFDKQS